jgi:hypothetical protein
MSGALGAVTLDASPVAPLGVLDELVLARVAADNGATRADLVRDLAPILSHKFSPSELRGGIELALEALLSNSHLQERRGRCRLDEAGSRHLAGWAGARKMPDAWSDIRDTRLVAAVLGLSTDPSVLNALERPDGLRAAILQKAFGVGGKRLLGSSRLRMALAVVALERAFGNKINSGLDAGRGLSVKASRLLAGQLARRPRDFGTDTRLIGALAAEAAGATQSGPTSLRQALLRRYVSERLDDGRSAPAAPLREVQADIEVPVSVEPPKDERPAAASRPDVEGFARTVLFHADAEADGWPGNRKAFISRVWRAIAIAHPEWGLSEIEFKSMLAETHRTGHVVLGSADMKSKETLNDVQDSAIAYKNTVWHFIRVEN